ncbi:hypothetical protein ACFC6L_28960 [Kitasatospora phosalacinea]|uniref:hypothetical protein n=1 Tax=Kitasatospora phosalacinea TaxID=2065 RepID=UPI0035D9CF3A
MGQQRRDLRWEIRRRGSHRGWAATGSARTAAGAAAVPDLGRAVLAAYLYEVDMVGDLDDYRVVVRHGAQRAHVHVIVTEDDLETYLHHREYHAEAVRRPRADFFDPRLLAGLTPWQREQLARTDTQGPHHRLTHPAAGPPPNR